MWPADGMDQDQCIGMGLLSFVGSSVAAEPFLASSYESDPDSFLKLRSLVSCWVLQGKVDAANALCERFQSEHPRYINAIVLRAELARATGRLLQAKDLLLHALDLDRKSPTALTSLARLEIELNHPVAVSEIREQIPRSFRNTDLDYVDLYLMLRRGETEAAKSWIESVTPTYGESVGGKSLLRSYLLLTRNPEGALALEDLPSHSAFNIENRAFLLIKAGRSVDAIAELADHPNKSAPSYFTQLGNAHYKLSDYESSYTALMQAFELGDEHPFVPYFAAKAALELGRKGEALKIAAAGCLRSPHSDALSVLAMRLAIRRFRPITAFRLYFARVRYLARELERARTLGLKGYGKSIGRRDKERASNPERHVP